MPRPQGSIALQVLLNPEHRTAAGVARVRAALEAAGLHVTGAGLATAVARVSDAAFEQTFGRPAPTSVSSGTGNQPADVELAIPSALRPYVQSITLAPKAILMDEPDSTDPAS